MKSKIYVLQKDLPSVKAGARYEYCDKNPASPYYQLMKEDESKIYNYSKEHGIRYGIGGYLFDAQVVENNPEWFKLLDHNYPIDYTIPSKYLSNIPTIKTNWSCKSLSDVLTEQQLITEKLQWYKKLSTKLDTILEYEDSDTVVVQLLLYYRKINNKIKKLELDLERSVPAQFTSWCNNVKIEAENKSLQLQELQELQTIYIKLNERGVNTNALKKIIINIMDNLDPVKIEDKK